MSVGLMLKILPHDFSVPKPIPTFGTRSTRRWYSQYQTLVFAVPGVGIHNTRRWYSQYQRMVSLVPVLGIMFTRWWYHSDRIKSLLTGCLNKGITHDDNLYDVA